MPSALDEVGSISLRAEHDLLASDAGQDAVAAGLFDGLTDYFGSRGDRRTRRARGRARGRRTAAGCGRRAAVLAAGRPRRTGRAAGDEHRDRGVAGGLAPRGRLGGLGRAVPRAAAGGSPAHRSRDSRPWARENRSSSRSNCSRSPARVVRWHGSRYRSIVHPWRTGGRHPRFSSPAKRPEVMRTAPNSMTRRYRRAGVRIAVAAHLARCYHAPSMRSGHRPPARDASPPGRTDRRFVRQR